MIKYDFMKTLQVGSIQLSPGQTRKHCCGNIVSCQRFAMFPNSQGGQTLGNNVSATKITLGKHEMFLNLIGNIFASREANFVSATMFPRVGKQGNFEETSRVTNVSATMFPSLPWALVLYRRIGFPYSECFPSGDQFSDKENMEGLINAVFGSLPKRGKNGQ